MTVSKEQVGEIREAHDGWVEAGGPYGNSERWIGVLLQALDERDKRIEELEAGSVVICPMPEPVEGKCHNCGAPVSMICHDEVERLRERIAELEAKLKRYREPVT